MIPYPGSEREITAELKRSSAVLDAGASAAAVNRTHRVVRERANTIRERKSRARSLWIPLTVSFGLLALLLSALWSALDESEFFADGMPDAAQQMLVLSMWCLPLSAAVLAVVWFRRLGSKASNGSAQ